MILSFLLKNFHHLIALFFFYRHSSSRVGSCPPKLVSSFFHSYKSRSLAFPPYFLKAAYVNFPLPQFFTIFIPLPRMLPIFQLPPLSQTRRFFAPPVLLRATGDWEPFVFFDSSRGLKHALRILCISTFSEFQPLYTQAMLINLVRYITKITDDNNIHRSLSGRT